MDYLGHLLWSISNSLELQFAIKIFLALIAWFVIGKERAAKGKNAGVSTFTYVILGSMIFSFLSNNVDPFSTSRIAGQVVSGLWFLWAGLIFVNKGDVRNLTTAAGLWLGSSIGMLIGFDYYGIALIVTFVTRFIPDGRGFLIKENIIGDTHGHGKNKSYDETSEESDQLDNKPFLP